MRRWSIALFRLCGIELEVHLSFLLLLAFAGYQGWSYGVEQGAPWRCAGWSVGFVVLVFVCVVLHELGHSLMARRFGVKVSRILLMPIGGMAQFDRIPREPGRELAIAIAGPAVNWVIALALFAATGWSKPLIGIPEYAFELPGCLLTANLVLGIFNLLPAFPMDGGRMLRAALATRLDYLRATRWAVRFGQAIALFGIFAAAYTALPLSGMPTNLPLAAVLFAFLAFVAERELNGVEQEELLAGLKVHDLMRGDFVALEADATIASALERLEHTALQDIVVVNDGAPLGVLQRVKLSRAARDGRIHDTCGQHAEMNVPFLQGDWPVIPVAIETIRRSPTLLPVLTDGRLAGVIDPRKLDESARLLRARGPQRIGGV